jgi:superfamily II DNA or RNA helicase
METYEELYEKYPNKEKVGVSLFKIIWNYLERKEDERINDYSKINDFTDSILDIIKYYKIINNVVDPNEELYEKFQKIYNDNSIKLKKFILYYKLLIDKNDDDNNKKLKIHMEDEDNIPVIDKIKEFIEILNSEKEENLLNTEVNNDEELPEDIKNKLIQDIETLNNFYRENQIDAIKIQRKQGFKNGIHAQIMGAGKSYIILQTIDDIFNKEIYQSNQSKNLILLITYRQEIFRNWFFKKDKDNEGKYIKNVEAYKEWKDNKIIDLNNYDIIDCINDKDKKQFENLSTTNKKTIVIINTTFFNNIDHSKIKENIKAVIIDECHCITQKIFTDKLSLIQSNIPFIGFSATPLRDTNKNSKTNLIKFFGNDNKLNIISSYTLMDAIHDNVVLPFKYHLVQASENTNTKEKAFESIFKGKIYPDLPFKKVCAWSRNQYLLKDWHEYIKNSAKYLKLYINSSFNDNPIYNDTPKDFEEFKKETKPTMMLCINMFKEGTDVPELDCGLYLDPVKKRSTIVSLQTAGRVLRLDQKYPNNKKKYGTLIDFYIKKGDKKNEDLTVNKIITYYESLINLTDNMDEKERFQEFKKIIDKIELKPTENKIILKIDNDPKHNCEFFINTVDFTEFTKLYKKKINKLIGIKEDEALQIEFNNSLEIFKTKFKFNINTNFEKDYNNQEDKYGLPDIFNDYYFQFKKFLDDKTLYEWLEINTDHLIKSKKCCKKFLSDNKIIINEDIDYYNVCKKYDCLPKDPRIFYGIDNFRGIKHEFIKCIIHHEI